MLLLADMRRLFDDEPSGGLFTAEILTALHQMDERPWPEFRNGKPITARQLAALLKPDKIKPKTVRRGFETEKGYCREWFEDAFSRYLPSRSVTASQPSDAAGLDEFRSVTPEFDVTDDFSRKASISADCDAVTDREPEEAKEWRF